MEGSERQSCLKVHGLTHGSACLGQRPWKNTAGPQHSELCKSEVAKAGPGTKQAQTPTGMGWDGMGASADRPRFNQSRHALVGALLMTLEAWIDARLPYGRFRFLCAHFRASAALDGLGAKCSERSS